MQPSQSKPNVIISAISGKCPNCRRGYVFTHKSIFPLKTLVELKDKCEVCGQKMKSEQNNGGGINYALTVIILFLNLAWYWPIFGLSYMDDSVYYFLATTITVVILLQPWLMRLSRMIYLYLYVPYGSGPSIPIND